MNSSARVAAGRNYVIYGTPPTNTCCTTNLLSIITISASFPFSKLPFRPSQCTRRAGAWRITHTTCFYQRDSIPNMRYTQRAIHCTDAARIRRIVWQLSHFFADHDGAPLSLAPCTLAAVVGSSASRIRDQRYVISPSSDAPQHVLFWDMAPVGNQFNGYIIAQKAASLIPDYGIRLILLEDVPQ